MRYARPFYHVTENICHAIVTFSKKYKLWQSILSYNQKIFKYIFPFQKY